jgi:hypothetical protein
MHFFLAIALKFITFFDQWVYFPTFPNFLDSTFLIIAATYLAWKARKRNPQKINRQIIFKQSKSLTKKVELEPQAHS